MYQKAQSRVENLLKTCSEVQTANTNDDDLKNSTTDTAVGEPPTKRVTTSDSCVGQKRKVTTTNIFKHSPLYPPAGEKSKNGAGRTLHNVKNFSGPCIDYRDYDNDTTVDLLSELSFSRKKVARTRRGRLHIPQESIKGAVSLTVLFFFGYSGKSHADGEYIKNDLNLPRKRHFDSSTVKLHSKNKNAFDGHSRQGKSHIIKKRFEQMTVLAILLSVHVGMGMLRALSVILKTFAFRDGYCSRWNGKDTDGGVIRRPFDLFASL